MPRHGEGSRGGWRSGKVKRIKVDEYSVGPQNVNLDGSNYRGAMGASYGDLEKMVRQAKSDGASTIWCGTLIRRTSKDKGFRWVSSSGRSVNEFLDSIGKARYFAEPVSKFAQRFHNLSYPVQGAVTWTIIAY